MDNQVRFAVGAIVAGLRKSGTIDDAAIDIIAAELDRAAGEAAGYGSFGSDTINQLASDVREMRMGS